MSINEQKRKHWRAHITKGLKHPKGVSAYCREENLSKSTFQYWSRSLKEEPARVVAKTAFASVAVSEVKTSLPDPEWLARFVGEFLRGAR